MDQEQILKKLEDIKNKFTDPVDANLIGSWQDTAKRLIMLKAVKENVAMQEVLTNLRTNITEMETLLLGADSKTLSDFERDRIIDRKSLYANFVGIFTNVETDLEKLEETLDNNLQNDNG